MVQGALAPCEMNVRKSYTTTKRLRKQTIKSYIEVLAVQMIAFGGNSFVIANYLQ